MANEGGSGFGHDGVPYRSMPLILPATREQIKNNARAG
ncbi:hypothetical protein MICA_340 [Micavibrio aeruginosavorus ARL-13]|uniref:Uncharacterized protein n=1 Tax=Micavibrio aeruginosavorus (strain ARL-13) TaxID=856793 RepID=G2KR33_MICAA|nr:hypothetical protein MICA_340 [Micavibrio aeruginosavorus ARL-13]